MAAQVLKRPDGKPALPQKTVVSDQATDTLELARGHWRLVKTVYHMPLSKSNRGNWPSIRNRNKRK